MRVITASEQRRGFHRRRGAAAAGLLPELLSAGQSPSSEPSSSQVPGEAFHQRLCTICQSSARPIKTFNLRLLVASSSSSSSSPPPVKSSPYFLQPEFLPCCRRLSLPLSEPSPPPGLPSRRCAATLVGKEKSQMLARCSHPSLGCRRCPLPEHEVIRWKSNGNRRGKEEGGCRLSEEEMERARERGRVRKGGLGVMGEVV